MIYYLLLTKGQLNAIIISNIMAQISKIVGPDLPNIDKFRQNKLFPKNWIIWSWGHVFRHL